MKNPTTQSEENTLFMNYTLSFLLIKTIKSYVGKRQFSNSVAKTNYLLKTTVEILRGFYNLQPILTEYADILQSSERIGGKSTQQLTCIVTYNSLINSSKLEIQLNTNKSTWLYR